jgi:hypothetical protein
MLPSRSATPGAGVTAAADPEPIRLSPRSRLKAVLRERCSSNVRSLGQALNEYRASKRGREQARHGEGVEQN